jgi:mono/diheme cytochrome c family protein
MRSAARFALLAGALTLAGGATPDEQNFSQVQRGRYLAILGDCAACHTAPGGKAFAGGRPIQTPFGIIVSPNITPDQKTGIGTWSDAQFIRSLQDGVGHDGEHLYPAMPYEYTTRATRADDLAIRAWLATLPPVSNKVVSDQLPFPLDIRASMRVWNALFFTPGVYHPDPGKSAEWNRGAYIVQGLAHCGACHTPKNILGADETSRDLQGAQLQGWFAPNITNDGRRGLGKWSAQDVVDYLRTGHNRFAAASGPMAEEVTLSSSQMSDSDLQDIATYLKSLPGQGDTATASTAGASTMRVGAAIYADECSACHAPNGQGIPGLFPALSGAPSIQSREPTSLIRVVLQGAQSVATTPAPTGPAMPAFGWMLSDSQIAAVLTYVRQNWGNAGAQVDEGDVSRARSSLEQHPG